MAYKLCDYISLESVPDENSISDQEAAGRMTTLGNSTPALEEKLIIAPLVDGSTVSSHESDQELPMKVVRSEHTEEAEGKSPITGFVEETDNFQEERRPVTPLQATPARVPVIAIEDSCSKSADDKVAASVRPLDVVSSPTTEVSLPSAEIPSPSLPTTEASSLTIPTSTFRKKSSHVAKKRSPRTVTISASTRPSRQ